MKRIIVERFRAIVAFVLCVLAFSSCRTMQTNLTPGEDLRSYKRAFIEATRPKDPFQIYPALVWELRDMGFDVVGVKMQNPTDSDLIVRFSYDEGWDLTAYLRAVQFEFINAKNGRVVVVSSYQSTGLWRGVRDGRLESAFNNLRAKNGFPPTKQFQ